MGAQDSYNLPSDHASDREMSPSQTPDAVKISSHNKFRNLLALLRFIRTINSDIGYPSLEDAHADKIERLPPRQKFTDAMTTILVMDHEIIAAVPLIQEAVSVILSEAPLNSINQGLIQVPGDKSSQGQQKVEDHDDNSPEGAYELSNNHTFVTVKNPRHDDVYSAQGPIFLFPKGEDLWPLVQAGNFSETLEKLKHIQKWVLN